MAGTAAGLAADVGQGDGFVVARVVGGAGDAGLGFRDFAFEFQAREEFIDVAAGADALDDFLAEVAAFGEVQGVGELGFLGQVGFGDVDAVERAGVEDAGGFDLLG